MCNEEHSESVCICASLYFENTWHIMGRSLLLVFFFVLFLLGQSGFCTPIHIFRQHYDSKKNVFYFSMNLCLCVCSLSPPASSACHSTCFARDLRRIRRGFSFLSNVLGNVPKENLYFSTFSFQFLFGEVFFICCCWVNSGQHVRVSLMIPWKRFLVMVHLYIESERLKSIYRSDAGCDEFVKEMNQGDERETVSECETFG